MDTILTSHLEGLLHSPTDFAILSLDLDGDLVLWNAGAAALFELPTLRYQPVRQARPDLSASAICMRSETSLVGLPSSRSAKLMPAHALELQVVAEGVERREQLLTLSRMKCDALQGYYFSRPMVPQRMTRWMKERSPHGL